MKGMKTNVLQSFLKVAETGSFSRAAEAVSISQPAITQHIKQLEDHFGVKLFVRTRQQLQLTREGRVLIKYVRRIMAWEQNLFQEIQTGGQQIRSLTVGITHTAESNLSIDALATYSHTMDRPNLKVYTNSTESLQSMVQNYELDFAFVDQASNSATLHYTTLDTDNLVLAVSPNHPWAKREQVSLEELKKESLILRLPQSNTRNMFVAALETVSMSIHDFNVFMEIDSIATIKDLVRRNFGLSVLAKSACMDEYRKGKLALLPIENLKGERTRYIVCRHDYEHPEVIGTIADIYRELMNP